MCLTQLEKEPQTASSVMQPRLRKQNYIKYVDRSVIDKDLLLRRKQVEISDNCNGNTWLVT